MSRSRANTQSLSNPRSLLENRQAPLLAAHESFDFGIVLEQIGPAPLAYDEFVAQCSGETFF
jgi:hypothetical protein